MRPARARLIAANAERLGADRVAVVVADATAPPFRPARSTASLVDAPCSGLGALRRRPDARWRLRPDDIDTLAALQRAHPRRCRCARPPRRHLVYSVCTLTAAESIDHR